RRRIVVEVDLRVSEIRQHKNFMLLRKRDEILVEIERCYVGGWIGRVADNDRCRLRNRMHDRPLERVKEVRRRLRGNRANCPTSHQEAECVDGVTWVRHQDDITWCSDGLRDVCEPFF